MGSAGGLALCARYRAVIVRIGATETLNGAHSELFTGDASVAIGVHIGTIGAAFRAIGTAFSPAGFTLFAHGRLFRCVNPAVAIGVDPVKPGNCRGKGFIARQNAVTVGIQMRHPVALSTTTFTATASAMSTAAFATATSATFTAMSAALTAHGGLLAGIDCTVAIRVGARKALID